MDASGHTAVHAQRERTSARYAMGVVNVAAFHQPWWHVSACKPSVSPSLALAACMHTTCRYVPEVHLIAYMGNFRWCMAGPDKTKNFGCYSMHTHRSEVCCCVAHFLRLSLHAMCLIHLKTQEGCGVRKHSRCITHSGRCYCNIPKAACIYVGGHFIWTAGCEKSECHCMDAAGQGPLPAFIRARLCRVCCW